MVQHRSRLPSLPEAVEIIAMQISRIEQMRQLQFMEQTQGREFAEKVLAVSGSGERLEFGSGSEAAKHFGVDPSTISLCCTGKLNGAKGWQFSYVEGAA